MTGVGVASIFGVKRKNDIYVVLKLCIIGITLFELLFEARARYLYLYVPIYIIFYIKWKLFRKNKKSLIG